MSVDSPQVYCYYCTLSIETHLTSPQASRKETARYMSTDRTFMHHFSSRALNKEPEQHQKRLQTKAARLGKLQQYPEEDYCSLNNQETRQRRVVDYGAFRRLPGAYIQYLL